MVMYNCVLSHMVNSKIGSYIVHFGQVQLCMVIYGIYEIIGIEMECPHITTSLM